jgi:hypothetical protein
MKPIPSRDGEPGERGHADGQRGHETTPGSDVQPDDAGTPESGNAADATAAQDVADSAGKTTGNKSSER